MTPGVDQFQGGGLDQFQSGGITWNNTRGPDALGPDMGLRLFARHLESLASPEGAGQTGCVHFRARCPGVFLAVLAGYLVPLDARAASPREPRAAGVWLAPQLGLDGLGTGHPGPWGAKLTPLPFGLEIGSQIHPRWLVSVALARLPDSDGATTLALLCARWYLAPTSLAPYLSTELGVVGDSVRSAQATYTRVSPLAAAGAGVELTLTSGLSFLGDVNVGPEDKAQPAGRSWQTSVWLRAGVGFRF